MSDDLIKRLRENIISASFEKRGITDGALAERLIRERHEAADRIESLEATISTQSMNQPKAL